MGSSCLFTQQMPMFTGNTPLMMYCLKAKKKFVKMNLKPHYLSCFHEFFKTRILLFLGLSTQGPLNLVLHDAPRPPLFHKITTPRPHTHKKRSQMIPSSIRKKCSTKQVQIPFSCFL